MILKKVEFNVVNIKKILNKEGKEERVLLILDPSNDECFDIVNSKNRYLTNYESIIRKQ